METMEAIKTIVSAGREDEVLEIVDKAVSGAARRYEEIRRETDYTEDARRARMDQVYQSRRDALNKELASLASRVGATDRDDVGRAFGTKGLPGDPASLMISMRDAQDRVAGVSSRDELTDLVRRATRNGDEVLARAVAQRATELQYDTVVNEFLRTRPELDEAVTRIWKSQNRDTEWFGWALRLSALKPAGV